jgi:hypothetical protein
VLCRMVGESDPLHSNVRTHVSCGFLLPRNCCEDTVLLDGCTRAGASSVSLLP